MSDSYPVDRIIYPWLGGVGFAMGLPVVLVELRHGAPSLTGDAIVAKVARLRRPLRDRAPRWTAIIGDTRLADNDLLLGLRVHVQCSTYIETDGSAPMCGRDGRLPMWEHVAVRVALPADKIHTERFDSVVVRDVPQDDDLSRFSAYLVKLGYNGPRYVEGRGAPTVVARAGRDWRATAPLVGSVAADGSWMFEADP